MEADQLRGAVEQCRMRVADLGKQVDDLQFADDARAAWRYETAVTRDNAERARHAAAVRGIDLDNPSERVTAEEWLDMHRAEQLAADADREITAADLDDADDHAPIVHSEKTAVEPATTQREPAPDSTSRSVNRASLALSTIDARAAEEAFVDDDDGLAAEDQRRDELARWSDDRAATTQELDDDPSQTLGRD